MISDLEREQMSKQRIDLVNELERLESEQSEDAHAIALAGADSIREDRISAIASELASLDAQIVASDS